MVKTRDQEISYAITFVGTAGGRNPAKTIHALRGIAGGPVHVLVTKGNVPAVNDGVGAVGDNQLKGIEFIAMKGIVTDRYPIDINGCWCDLVKHLTIAVARIDIGPKWRNDAVADRWKSCCRKGRQRTGKGDVTVVVDVNGVVRLAVQIEGKWNRNKTG